MPRTFYFASFVFIAIFQVSGLVASHSSHSSHSTHPTSWTAILEPYDVYHRRYIALQCYEKHNTHYFNQCCRPFLASESSNLIHHCVPHTATPHPSTGGAFDDSEDCEEVDDFMDEPARPHRQLSQRSDDARPSHVIAPSQSQIAETSPTIGTLASSTPMHISGSSRLTQMKKHGHIIASKHTLHSDFGQVYTGGYATYFYQNGNAGACGRVHSDDDLIAAIDADRYGNLGLKSDLCGRKVKITNPSRDKSVVVTIVDACPTCRNSNSIDLSLGAFRQIADVSQGIVSITWAYA